MPRFLVRSFLCLVFLSGGFGTVETRAEPPQPDSPSESPTHGESGSSNVIDCVVVSTVGSSWSILRDGTCGFFVEDLDLLCRQPGARIRATVARRPGNDSQPAVVAVKPLGFDPGVARAAHITTADMARPDLYDFRRVTVCGTVTDVIHDELDPKWVILLVEADGSRAVIQILLSPSSGNLPFPSDAELTDAEVRASGVFLAKTYSGRKHLGAHIANYDGHAVTVVRPAPKDPFAECRPTAFDPSSVSTAKRDAHRRQTTGRVVATFGPSSAILALADGERLRVRFAKGRSVPPPDTTVDVVGFVRSNVFYPSLANAIWRENAAARIPPDAPCEDVVARDILFDKAGQQMIKQDYDGRIIRLSGRITEVFSLPNDRVRMEINSDGIVVNVEAPASVAAPEAGSVVSVTGACLLLDSADDTDGFVRLNGFSIALRTADDLTVISAPPWWTVRRILYALLVIVALMLAVLVWNILLQRLAERRGAQLAQAEIARARSELKRVERTRLAVELHDSLSQNLTGIVLQLDASHNARATDELASERHRQAALRMLQGCRTELRRCIWDLHSSILDLSDFEEAIRISLRPVACNIRLAVRSHVPREMLSDNVAHAVIRILRELVTNAIRHGHATNVRVAGDIRSGPLKFSVTDDGCGFPKNGPAGPEDGHFGLTGIRERLKDLGGSIAFEALRPSGTKATFTIPRPHEPRQEQPT